LFNLRFVLDGSQTCGVRVLTDVVVVSASVLSLVFRKSFLICFEVSRSIIVMFHYNHMLLKHVIRFPVDRLGGWETGQEYVIEVIHCTHAFIHLIIHSFFPSFIHHSFIHSFFYSFIHSFHHSFFPSFLHLFIR